MHGMLTRIRLLGTKENVSRKPSLIFLISVYVSLVFPLLYIMLIVSSLFYSLASLKSHVSTTSCLVQTQITYFFKSNVNLSFVESSILC